MFVTNSTLLLPEVRELLQSDRELVVSGCPLNIWQDDGKEFHFFACSPIIDMPFIPRLVIEAEINPTLNHRLHPTYTGVYIVMLGSNPETNDEYRFGIKDELQFCLRALQQIDMID